MTKRDYYEVLGLSKSATEGDIKKAYRRLAKEFHPDQNKGKTETEAKFKEVTEAYDVLSDKEKRGKYDQFGHAGIDPRHGDPQQAHYGPGNVQWTSSDGGVVDFDDLSEIFGFGGRDGGGHSGFENLFRSRGGRAEEPTPAARDLEHEVTLTFEQAVHGITLDLQLAADGKKKQTISVHIPAGVRDGQRIRVRGKGQPASGRRPAGDLYVVCRISPHRYFTRVDDDIYLVVPISLSEAALGAKIDLPTVDGVHTVTVPAGTASGAKLRLSGLGVPNPKTGARGNQYAAIKIAPPGKPTDAQRKLMEQYAETLGATPREGLWS